MKRKHHLLLYGALAAALLVAVITAYDRHTAAQQSRLILEDHFTRQLMETQEHLQSISIKLSKAPVTADAAACVELLSGVSRQASEAASALSALPLSHEAVGSTVKFLNQLSDYALALTLRAASGDLPGASDVETLGDLRALCVRLGGHLATADASGWPQDVFYEPIRLAERPLEAMGDKDNGMDYPAMIYDGAFSDARHRGAPKALGREIINQEKAIEIARDFVGADRVAKAEAGVPTGGVIECYGVTLTLNGGEVLNADVTRQGGKLLWIMPEHANFSPVLTLEECTAAALDFLSSRGFGPMEANHYQVYDGLAVINFVAVENGVLLYPDLIKVQLRMDTGELVGLESNNYLMNHTPRGPFSPAISQSQARSLLSPRLKVNALRLCVIPYRDGERLCWEAAGQYADSEYRVYLDAQTGEEIQVLQMVDSAHGRLAA